MNTQQTEQLNLSNFLHILLLRKWLVLCALIGVLSPIIAYNEFSPRLYRADTSIVVEQPKEPAVSMSSFQMPVTKNFIVNQIEEIKSRSFAEQVVKALPVEIIKAYPLPEKTASNFNEEEYIAKQVQDRISANVIENSEVIKIEIEAHSPIAAKVIANTVALVLKRRNLEFRSKETTHAAKTIEQQLETYKKRLDDSELALKTFKERNKVTMINKEAEEIYNRITEAETIYNQTKANLDAAKRRISFIQNRLASERNDLVPEITKITSPLAQKLKQQLVDLEVQYTTLKVQNYSENHPKLLQLKDQIEHVKNNLKNESLKIALGENIVDPISQIQRLIEESIALEIQLQTYQAQEKTLKGIINNYNRMLYGLPEKEIQLAQILRDKEVNEKIYMMLLQKKEEAKIASATGVGNIRIIDPAKLPRRPVKPRKKLNLILGIMLGSMMGIGLVILSEYFDSSMKTVEQVEQTTELSILGTIPKIRTNIKKAIVKDLKQSSGERAAEMISNLVTIFIPKSPESEAFRTLRTNLQLSRIVSPFKTILITSPNPCEGKSIIAANLSITTAQMGMKTLLVDTDLKKPTLHTLFQKERKPGLMDILISTKNITNKYQSKNIDFNLRYQRNQTASNLEQVLLVLSSKTSANQLNDELLKSSIRHTISSTHIANLDLLTCGSIPTNPSKILASMAMKNIFQELKNQYEIIFIDTLPINIFTDAALLSSIVDGSMLVIKSGTSSAKEILGSKELLEKARSKIIGLVLNYSDSPVEYSKYYYYHTNGRK